MGLIESKPPNYENVIKNDAKILNENSNKESIINEEENIISKEENINEESIISNKKEKELEVLEQIKLSIENEKIEMNNKNIGYVKIFDKDNYYFGDNKNYCSIMHSIYKIKVCDNKYKYLVIYLYNDGLFDKKCYFKILDEYEH